MFESEHLTVSDDDDGVEYPATPPTPSPSQFSRAPCARASNLPRRERISMAFPPVFCLLLCVFCACFYFFSASSFFLHFHFHMASAPQLIPLLRARAKSEAPEMRKIPSAKYEIQELFTHKSWELLWEASVCDSNYFA